MPEAPPPCAPPLELALVQIGQMCVGIPIEQVQQALPRSAALRPLPRRDQALIGVLAVGPQSLPVVDLSRWVEVPAAAHSDPSNERILVLTDGTRQLGLLVQAVLGVRRIAGSARRTLHHQASAEEVFEAVAPVEGIEGFVNLLETDRLMALAQVWSAALDTQDAPGTGLPPPDSEAAAARLTAGPSPAAPRAPAGASRYAVLRLGDRLLGFPAMTLAELLPRPPMQALGGSEHAGIASWRGRHLPVVDLGSGWPPSAATTAPPWLLVLCHGDLALGLLMHEVRDLLMLHPDQIDAPPQALAGLGCVQGLAHDAAGDPIHLVDVEALMRQHPEAQISRVTASAGAVPHRLGAGSAPVLRNEQPYLVFEAGAQLCTPVAAVREILPLLPEQVPQPGQTPAPFAWRGQWLDLIDLPARLRPRGRPARAPSHVLVVQQADGLQGFLIDTVSAMVPTGRAPLSQLSLGQGRACDVLTLGEADQQRHVRRIDLSLGLASLGEAGLGLASSVSR